MTESGVPEMTIKWLRFRDLKARGIVKSWPQLRRLIKQYGFPPGRMLSPNIRAWPDDEIDVEGKILDGRNRYRAAQMAGVPYPTRTYDGDDPIGFVISMNLARRHLSESQRAMVAAKLATFTLGDNQHSEGLPIGRASELLNVGERSVARAR
jgi:hypothetical protein